MKLWWFLLAVMLLLPYRAWAEAPEGCAAEIDGFSITWKDVDRILRQAGLKEPSEQDRQKMLDAEVARVLLAREAEKRGLIEKPEVKHLLELCKIDALASFYVRENFSHKEISISDKELRNYYLANREKLNPTRRKVVIADVYCIGKQCKSSKMDEVAKEIAEALSKQPERLREVTEAVRQKWPDLQISFPTESVLFSNSEYYKVTGITQKIFSTPPGMVFYEKMGERNYKVVLIKEDKGPLFDEKRGVEEARKDFLAQKRTILLEKEIERLKKQYNVKILSPEGRQERAE